MFAMLSIQPNVMSEHGELKTVMLCRPPLVSITHAQTLTDIRWDKKVDHEKLLEDFVTFKAALEQAGVQVVDYAEYLSPEDRSLSDELINRHFVRDMACVLGKTVLPGEAGTFARRPEYVHAHLLMEDWFPRDSFLLHQNDDLKAMECGDIMVLSKDAVLINVGMRTSLESIMKVKNSIFQSGFSEIGIISLPRGMDTLHLDMGLNVANKDLIIAKNFIRHLPAQVLTEKKSSYEMSETFFNRHGFEIHWLEKYNTVPDINFISINPDTLMMSKQANLNILKDHPKLQKKQIIEVDVAELEKTGGGLRCMTMPLIRH